MLDSSQILTAVVPIFLVIVLGIVVRKLRWLTGEADKSLTTLVIYLLYPLFIVTYILGNDALREPRNILLPPLVGFVSVVGPFGMLMYAARCLNLGNVDECRTFAFSNGIYNYAYFAIPIVALLLSPETMGVLLVFNVGVEIAVWTVGVGFLLPDSGKVALWRRVMKPPVIAILIAVPINLIHLDNAIPEPVLETVNLLGQAAIPLGLLIIGATFYDLVRGASLFNQWQVPLASIVLRIGVLPAIFLLFAWIFPFSPELKGVLIVQAAMPCGVFPIVLARQYGGSTSVALKAVLATTAVSIVSIPIWISYGLQLIAI